LLVLRCERPWHMAETSLAKRDWDSVRIIFHIVLRPKQGIISPPWNEPEYVGTQAPYIFISLELSHSRCLLRIETFA
jgi:hypothetical protein